MRVPHLHRRVLLLLLGVALLPGAVAGALGAPAGRAADAPSPFAGMPASSPPLPSESPTIARPARPRVEWLQPVPGAREVSRFAPIRVRFDRAVRGVSGSTVNLRDAARGTAVAADVSYDPVTFTVTLRPRAPLPPGRRIEARLDDGIRELSGGRLAPQRWTFAVTADVTAPAVTLVSPARRSEAVPWETSVTLEFSEPVRGVSATTVMLRDERTGRIVAGTVTYDAAAGRAVFVPAAPLWAAHLYRVVVGPEISDPVGNPLEPRAWTFRARPLDGARPGPVVEVPAAAPLGVWHVPTGDFDAVAALGVDLVIRKFRPGDDLTAYLDAAERAGLKVILGFDYIYDGGVVRTELVGPVVAPIREHPALYGYLAVTEPNLHGISLAEMRALYAAYKTADPARPVLVSIGLISEFGSPANPWGPGAADIVLAEWYPIVFPSWVAPQGWRTDTPRVLAHFRHVVERSTPGLPVWLVAQGHEYRLANRRSPTEAELADQVRDAFRYLGASGVTFYPWNGGGAYQNDFGRDDALQAVVRQVVTAVRTRTLFS